VPEVSSPAETPLPEAAAGEAAGPGAGAPIDKSPNGGQFRTIAGSPSLLTMLVYCVTDEIAGATAAKPVGELESNCGKDMRIGTASKRSCAEK